MGATIMQQAVKFAARLDRTTQMADMFADGLHGMTAASDALKKVMDEFGMPMQDDPDIEPIGHDEACDTAETLYHELLKHASSGHMTLRFAQTMNRAWAELTRQRWIDGSVAMRHTTECGGRDVMRFVRETAGCLVEKDIELRGAVEDLDRRIEEIRLQIVMLGGKKEGRGR